MLSPAKKTKITAIFIAIVVVVITVFAVVAALRYRDRWDNIIAAESANTGIEFSLLKRLIWVESKNDPAAVSPAGAIGLMQLMPDTAFWMAERMEMMIELTDLTDPKINIRLGAAYLAHLKKKFDNDIRLALIAYNAGEGTLRRWLNIPEFVEDGELVIIPYRETREYVRKILR